MTGRVAGKVAFVTGTARRIVTEIVDVRDFEALRTAVDSGVEQLGRLDIIVANAGIGSKGASCTRWTSRPGRRPSTSTCPACGRP